MTRPAGPISELRRHPLSASSAFRLLPVALLALAACSSNVSSSRSDQSTSARYPAEVRANFMDSCTLSGGSASRCECVLEQFEENYSMSEFALFEIALNSNGDVPPKVLELLARC